MDKPPEVEPLLAAYRAYIELMVIETDRLNGIVYNDETAPRIDLEAERNRKSQGNLPGTQRDARTLNKTNIHIQAKVRQTLPRYSEFRSVERGRAVMFK